ncbi:GntR family transcriptional regulator [Methylobacterium sp. NEAU 140]|uniref:GntR family transcriptional regulator n=1 Tax=Methylobacterium sp. NEAU 140 TaxID=3064945 RepID=UPI0027334490|nr:GntR family transcriptional regulator [Methylobacterium sp. NEAU 140]MDP4022973.1 GntR family transcriptional regulator [Methylobacterium sp. NEAU 140]
MRANTVYKRAYNQCLDILAGRPLGAWPVSEARLAGLLAVSRTTVRAILASLDEREILRGAGGARALHRLPDPRDYFPDRQTETVAQAVARRFMQWVLEGDCRPGQTISALDLARRFGTSTTAVREYLTHFARFGLIERRQNSGWIFVGVTRDFATEIYEVREMFELRSARAFIALPGDDPAWADLDAIEREHHRLLRDPDGRDTDFARLDERLHRLVYDAARNRFMREFYDLIAFVFHYHYQWNKADERERNRVALEEHLVYIAALRSRDARAVDAACRAHLRTVRATLLRSIGPEPARAGVLSRPASGPA